MVGWNMKATGGNVSKGHKIRKVEARQSLCYGQFVCGIGKGQAPLWLDISTRPRIRVGYRD